MQATNISDAARGTKPGKGNIGRPRQGSGKKQRAVKSHGTYLLTPFKPKFSDNVNISVLKEWPRIRKVVNDFIKKENISTPLLAESFDADGLVELANEMTNHGDWQEFDGGFKIVKYEDKLHLAFTGGNNPYDQIFVFQVNYVDLLENTALKDAIYSVLGYLFEETFLSTPYNTCIYGCAIGFREEIRGEENDFSDEENNNVTDANEVDPEREQDEEVLERIEDYLTVAGCDNTLIEECKRRYKEKSPSQWIKETTTSDEKETKVLDTLRELYDFVSDKDTDLYVNLDYEYGVSCPFYISDYITVSRCDVPMMEVLEYLPFRFYDGDSMLQPVPVDRVVTENGLKDVSDIETMCNKLFFLQIAVKEAVGKENTTESNHY